MAEAVLERALALIDREILDAAQSSGTLKARIRRIVAALDRIYAGGRTPCVLGQLATSGIGAVAKKSLHLAFSHWIEGIGALARESGMAPVKARHFAEDWVARLQGTLILQAASEDAGPYKRTMNTLLELSKEDTAPM